MTLEEIRELLEKAQLGPWEAEDTGDVVVASTRRVIADFVPRASDRLLLAAAPELAALLVRAVEALDNLQEQHGGCIVDPVCGDCPVCRARSLLRELGVEV